MCVITLASFLSSAVQEERQRAKERGDEVESTTSANSEMPVEMILDAEMALENQLDVYTDNPNDIAGSFVMAAEKQMYALVDWAKRIPHFTELSLEDQVILLRTGCFISSSSSAAFALPMHLMVLLLCFLVGVLLLFGCWQLAALLI